MPNVVGPHRRGRVPGWHTAETRAARAAGSPVIAPLGDRSAYAPGRPVNPLDTLFRSGSANEGAGGWVC